jgi:hypothetical protein
MTPAGINGTGSDMPERLYAASANSRIKYRFRKQPEIWCLRDSKIFEGGAPTFCPKR